MNPPARGIVGMQLGTAGAAACRSWLSALLATTATSGRPVSANICCTISTHWHAVVWVCKASRVAAATKQIAGNHSHCACDRERHMMHVWLICFPKLPSTMTRMHYSSCPPVAHLLPGDIVDDQHCITALQVVCRHLQAVDMAANIPELQSNKFADISGRQAEVWTCLGAV